VAGDPRKIRVFFAVAPAAAVHAAAVESARTLRELPGASGIRWVREEGLHVTLRFVGEIDPALVSGLVDRVKGETVGLAPFPLGLGAARWFPSERRPQMVVLDVEPPTPLERLAAAVERGVVAAGFAPESRPFRAHLTLGRVKKDQALQLDVTAVDTAAADACEVTEVMLFRSELDRRGARYTPLACVPLAASDEPIHP
jgi:2'-5' RNA ligase